MEDKKLPVHAEETSLAKQEENDHPWLKLSDKAKQGLDVVQKAQKTKHGLFANIPIVCKADDCPYTDTCAAYQSDLAPIGEPCIQEIALIMKLYQDYTQTLQIDTSQVINLGLIKNLIDAEVEIHRCEAILARDADILPDRIVAVTQMGMVFKQPEAHPAIAIKEKAIARKNTAWQLLNGTPKDKAKMEASVLTDPSTYASRLLKEFKRKQKLREQEGEIIDVTPESKTRTNNENIPSTD